MKEISQIEYATLVKNKKSHLVRKTKNKYYLIEDSSLTPDKK